MIFFSEIFSVSFTLVWTRKTVDSPPTILYTLLDGTLGLDSMGRLVVLPGTILHLDCLFRKNYGEPKWSVTNTTEFDAHTRPQKQQTTVLNKHQEQNIHHQNKDNAHFLHHHHHHGRYQKKTIKTTPSSAATSTTR